MALRGTIGTSLLTCDATNEKGLSNVLRLEAESGITGQTKSTRAEGLLTLETGTDLTHRLSDMHDNSKQGLTSKYHSGTFDGTNHEC